MQWKKKAGQDRQSALEERFRPSSSKDFSPAIQDFISKVLSKKLTTQEQERLQKAEGKWPEYPRTLLNLSRKHDLQVPGMTLPGPRDLWDRAKTALPEVPERALFHFLWSELTRAERDQLRLSPGEPGWRERVKQEFFKRHPKELRRLQQLDFSPRNSVSKNSSD
jgi:hypothetical protein